MAGDYLIRWQNPEAKGSVDLIKAELLASCVSQKNLQHAMLDNDNNVVAHFDLDVVDDALIFKYGGKHRTRNEKNGIFIGDMRIVTSTFATAIKLDWRDDPGAEWENVRVKVEPAVEREGHRRKTEGSQISRSSLMARLKLADAEAQGALACKACDFRGHSAYTDKLKSCFEVHHHYEISHGLRDTELKDLSILCACCHSAMHALNLSVDAFKARFD